MNVISTWLLFETFRLVIGGFIVLLGYRFFNIALFRADDFATLFEKPLWILVKRSMPGFIALCGGLFIVVSSGNRPAPEALLTCTQLCCEDKEFKPSSPSKEDLKSLQNEKHIEAASLAVPRLRKIFVDLEIYLRLLTKDPSSLSDVEHKELQRVRSWLEH